MQATVTTFIEGWGEIKHTGRYIKKTHEIVDSKGMRCKIKEGDTVEFHEPKKRKKREVYECPMDLHQWFKKTKQI